MISCSDVTKRNESGCQWVAGLKNETFQIVVRGSKVYIGRPMSDHTAWFLLEGKYFFVKPVTFTFESYFVWHDLIIRRIFCVSNGRPVFTNLLNWLDIWGCQNNDVSADFWETFSLLFLLFGESFSESLMEFYQRLFHLDLVAKHFCRFLEWIS